MYSCISQNTGKEFPEGPEIAMWTRVHCQQSWSLGVDGVIVRWHLHISKFKPFPGLKCMAGPDWSKKLLNQWTLILHSKLYGSQPSSDMAGLNSKLSVISGCTKPTKRRKNARNQGNKLRPDHNCSRKDASASAKAAHTVHCFWRKCSVVFDRERLADVNKIKLSECSAFV